MPMAPYTMDVPWAGSLGATISVTNSRIIEAVAEFAKANKIEKKQVLVRYLGSDTNKFKVRVFRYSIGKVSEGVGCTDQ